MKLLGTLFATRAAPDVGIVFAFLTNSHRYRLPIKVGTREGQRITSSVIQAIRSWATLSYGRVYGHVLPSSTHLVARSAFKAAVVAVMLFASAAAAASQSFNPARKLTTRYSDRSVADIQIVGPASELLNAGVRIEKPPSGEFWIFAEDSLSKGTSDHNCATRYTAFVRELDILLVSNPRTIYPVHDLINKYFPVVACDIHEAIEVSRRSRFFSHTSEETTYYVIAFDSKGFAGPFDRGFHVQINLLKASGNSSLPSANVNP